MNNLRMLIENPHIDKTTHQSLLHLKHLKASGFKQFPGVE